MTAIIMLNWNGASDTLECIDSLRRVEGDFFCVVADNGSADDSTERIEAYFQEENLLHRVVNFGEELKQQPANHEYILYKIGENLGFAKGNNAAIRLIASAKPDHYLLLNNDTIVEADFLQQLETFARNHPDHLALTPLMLVASKNGDCASTTTPSSPSSTSRRLVTFPSPSSPAAPSMPTLLCCRRMAPCSPNVSSSARKTSSSASA